MALETNNHVLRLRRFQPFQADSAELIYEQSDPTEPGFDTKTLAYVSALLEDTSVRLIILTGDAGHGKTSICARLIEGLGLSPSKAAEQLEKWGDASGAIAQTQDGRSLRILKDLSDIDVDRGAELLEQLMDPASAGVSIVCANEGRLRRAVSTRPTDDLLSLTRALELGISQGSVTDDRPEVRVVNLNFQSVAPDSGRGIVDWALRTWGADRRRWKVCARCDASPICPILANHQNLADEARGSKRRAAVHELFATAERAGSVITTRQALATLAYAITGGLQCADVHRRYIRGSRDRTWQYAHLFHQALFGDILAKGRRAQVPAMGALRRIDPGSSALREVDDILEPGDPAIEFLPPTPSTDEGSPKSRREAQRESEVLRALMRFLRRRDFVDAESGPSRLGRMGFQAGEDFKNSAGADKRGSVEIRDRLLSGMEAVQGLHRPGQPPDFLVLDPAFMTHRSRAAVVALRVPSREVRVTPHRAYWADISGKAPELPAAMDWIDRLAYLTLTTEASSVAIPLDLYRFELLYRWAEGLSSRSQHEAEVRHLTGALGRLVPSGTLGDEITVLVNGDRRTLTVDVGDRVRSGEG